jgi:hypothetical protein
MTADDHESQEIHRNASSKIGGKLFKYLFEFYLFKIFKYYLFKIEGIK